MNVYFTVDTESSMGGAWRSPARRPLAAERHVFCRRGAQELGIPLIVQLLKRYGLRGTFFVETLATRCLGEADTRSIFDFLLEAGQDVQLHIHPNFRFYAEWRKAQGDGTPYTLPQRRDEIGAFEETLQLDLLGEAARYFEQFTGVAPKAFRAGCYAGSNRMMRCLRQLGITADSSFNPCYAADLSFPGEAPRPNRVEAIEGVWEIPVTVARTKLPEGYNGFKFADCTSLCFAELRAMLDACAAGGQKHFVIVFHSFSAVKTKDETYAGLRPNRIVIRRLEQTLRYLSEHGGRFRVETMGNIAAQPDALATNAGVAVVPALNVAVSAVRKAVQLANSPYWT
jgi:hypothetical protein